MESVNTHTVSRLSSLQFNRLTGAFLRRRREALNLTGHELGQMMHLSQQQISRYERGVNSMTLYQLHVFMQVLGFSWNDFFNHVIALSATADKDGSLKHLRLSNTLITAWR